MTTSDKHEIMRLVQAIAEMEWSNGACHDTPWFTIHIVDQTVHSRRCAARIREILGLPPRTFRTSRHMDLRHATQIDREFAGL